MTRMTRIRKDLHQQNPHPSNPWFKKSETESAVGDKVAAPAASVIAPKENARVSGD